MVRRARRICGPLPRTDAGCGSGRRPCNEAIAGVEQAVDEYLADREGDIPPPLTERKFSGKFLVRTSPTLHSQLTVEAAEQNVSMNQWVVQKLAGRAPIGLFDL